MNWKVKKIIDVNILVSVLTLVLVELNVAVGAEPSRGAGPTPGQLKLTLPKQKLSQGRI